MDRFFIFLVIWICCINIELVAQEEKPFDSKLAESVINEFVKRKKFNGAILIAKDAKILFHQVYGWSDAQKKVPLDLTSAFNLASVSKAFTAMAVMILMEQQKLNLEDSLTRFFPEFPYPEITILHLLHHTSGLADYIEMFDESWDSKNIVTNEDILKQFQSKKPPLLFKPGEKFDYSNTGYALLGLLVERASQQTFADFLKAFIFDPLDMKDSCVYHLKIETFPKKRVFGFDYKKKNKIVLNDLGYLDGIVGDGGVYSTTGDLLKWEQSFYTEKLISKKTLEFALSPGTLNSGEKTDYGLGWCISEEGTRIEHDGEWAGFQTTIRRNVPQKTTLIVLENSTTSMFDTVCEILEKMLSQKPYQLPWK